MLNLRVMTWMTASIGLLMLPNVMASEKSEKAASFYTVDVYDPERSADDDLKATVAKAKAEKKRILIQVGGDWCGWCRIMSKYFLENGKVSKALSEGFLIMKVNYSEDNENEDFLGKYPRIQGYPHLYVLDSDGKLLHSQNTADLEEGKGYNEEKVLEFLNKWAPERKQ